MLDYNKTIKEICCDGNNNISEETKNKIKEKISQNVRTNIF